MLVGLRVVDRVILTVFVVVGCDALVVVVFLGVVVREVVVEDCVHQVEVVEVWYGSP